MTGLTDFGIYMSKMLVHRILNNWTEYLPVFPIARFKKPRRSPLRLRFLNRTLKKTFCALVQLFCERCTGDRCIFLNEDRHMHNIAILLDENVM